MEGRVRKYSGSVSPERSRAWAETATKQQQQQPQQMQQHRRKIPVVYYLCRNRHLEHPHFVEVPLSSSDGLYLRDVINRLNAVRGKGMAAMYSWSCKRSYKNGFVWHDLSEDELVLPAHGSEYVLKGSELLDQTPPDRPQHSTSASRSQHLKHTHEEIPIVSRVQEASSSSPPTVVIREARTSPPPAAEAAAAPPSPPPPTQEDELSPPPHRPASSGNVSPETSAGIHPNPICKASSRSPVEYCVYNPFGAADASTQTEDGAHRKPHSVRDTCTRGVSTDEGSPDLKFDSNHQNHAHRSSNANSEIERADEISPPPASSTASSSSGKTETLESLIQADARKINSFRIVEEEEMHVPPGPKLKAANVLMQLITCGSISVKDNHGFALVPAYGPRFSQAKFPSRMFASSMMLGELDCLVENPRFMGLRMEDKEYFSGSLIEAKKLKEEVGDGMLVLKRSSSYNADRNIRSRKSPESRRDKERVVDSSRSKCLPRTIKMASNKQVRNEAVRSPLLEGTRNSSAVTGSSLSTSLPSSKGGSKRFTDPSLANAPSMKLESFKEDKEKVIKIEERLSSGARVIIQSQAPCDDSEDSYSSG